MGSCAGVGSGVDVVGPQLGQLSSNDAFIIKFKIRKNKNFIKKMRVEMKRIQSGNVPEISIHVGLI